MVLWAGLILVIVRAVSSGQWAAVWGTISQTAAAATSTPAAATSTPATAGASPGTPTPAGNVPYAAGYTPASAYTQQAQQSATGSPGNVPLVAGGAGLANVVTK
jgi:hypothetical protein